MSVRTGLDRLQKEIDALSYNARSILNALIRSVTASGSNRGFKATRGGEDIYLSRIDIYRLYTFYQEWENNDFATENRPASTGQRALTGFDELLAKHDQIPVKDSEGNETDITATTTSIILHSKIMFQTEDNKDTVEDEKNAFWINLIKTNNNPKGVSNSSPIPINLRTPILDENLATTKYNQHPTYLFPMGYFTRDTLGFQGDGIDHRLEGDSWTIQGDDYVRLESNFISLGNVDPTATLKTRDARTGPRSTSMGYDCHAQGDSCIAGGLQSFVPDNSQIEEGDTQTQTVGAIALGYQNIASFNFASSIGGSLNSASGEGTSVLGGYSNKVSGKYGAILGGTTNIVGGKVHTFSFPFRATLSGEDDIGTPTSGENDIIIIPGDLTINNEFQAGDTVRLFDFTINAGENVASAQYYDVAGDGDKAFEAKVRGVAYNVDGKDEGSTQINLDTTIPRKTVIDGGSISLVARDGNALGYSSIALGEGVIATGQNQIVVGRYNEVVFDDLINSVPRFIVGTGTNTTDDRKNTLEVYKYNVFFYGSDPNPELTDSKFSPTAKIGTSVTPAQTLKSFRFCDFGLESYIGQNHFFVFDNDGKLDAGFEFVGQVNADDEYRIAANNETGIKLLSGPRGIQLRAGAETDDNSFTIVPDTNNVVLQAEENIMLEGFNSVSIKASTQSTLNLEFGNISLVGDTFGALPTDQNQFSLFSEDSLDSKWSDGTGADKIGCMTIFRSGFYGLTTLGDPFLGKENTSTIFRANENEVSLNIVGEDTADIEYNAIYHMINSSFLNPTDGNYYNWQMLYGAHPDLTDARIGVRRGRSGDGWLNSNALEGQNINYLGWLSDNQFVEYGIDSDGESDTTLYNDGEWREIPETVFQIRKVTSLEDQYAELSPTGNYGTSEVMGDTDLTMKYTKVGTTVFFELIINIGTSDLDSLGTSEVSAILIHIPNDSVKEGLILSSALAASPPSFTCSTYYREIHNDYDPSTVGPGYYKRKLYTLQVLNKDSNNETTFVISTTCDYPHNSQSPNNTDNIFSTPIDTNKNIGFSGFYNTEVS